MIFVTTGTCDPFDRLLEMVDAVELGDTELVVQHGVSPVRPRAATCVAFLTYDEVIATMRRSDTVVTHAGVGSILTSLACGKRPIVVPRLRRYGDAVDDHQLELAERLVHAGLVTMATDERGLAAAVAATRPRDAAPSVRVGGRLAAELGEFIASHAR